MGRLFLQPLDLLPYFINCFLVSDFLFLANLRRKDVKDLIAVLPGEFVMCLALQILFLEYLGQLYALVHRLYLYSNMLGFYLNEKIDIKKSVPSVRRRFYFNSEFFSIVYKRKR